MATNRTLSFILSAAAAAPLQGQEYVKRLTLMSTHIRHSFAARLKRFSRDAEAITVADESSNFTHTRVANCSFRP